MDSFATDPLQPEEIKGVTQLHPSAYESASSEEFYYPDIASELGVSFEIMESPSGRTRRQRHRDSIQVCSDNLFKIQFLNWLEVKL